MCTCVPDSLFMFPCTHRNSSSVTNNVSTAFTALALITWLNLLQRKRQKKGHRLWMNIKASYEESTTIHTST